MGSEEVVDLVGGERVDDEEVAGHVVGDLVFEPVGERVRRLNHWASQSRTRRLHGRDQISKPNSSPFEAFPKPQNITIVVNGFSLQAGASSALAPHRFAVPIAGD